MSWIERDKKHLWHALTQHQTSSDPLTIVKTQGVWLIDENGNKYLDAISSWYTSMYGHCHPQIVRAVTEQLQQMDHVVFSGFTHPTAIELSEKLIEILPDNQNKLFFSDNGSTAVEVAIKMAFQFHFNLGSKKSKVLAFENSFHGDTFGAMSASGLNVYNGPFSDFFINVERLEVPSNDNIESLCSELDLKLKSGEFASFIYEPLIQGANCMQMHSANHLNQLLEICKKHNVLCIADEVMTGFGKTGYNFASDLIKTKPDFICLSKALTGGTVPMAITSTTEEVYQAFLSDNMDKAFLHAHTYTATPVACRAAITSIDLLNSEEIQKNIQLITKANQKFARELTKHPKVESVRHNGVILALDLQLNIDRYGEIRNKIYNYFMQRRIYLRPLGKTIYWVPSFIIKPSELEFIFQTVRDFLNEFDFQ